MSSHATWVPVTDRDFDETLPGPFEFDVKRMAASFAVAGRNNGFGEADTRASTLASATAYREAMAGFAQTCSMVVWYACLDEGELIRAVRGVAAGTAKSAKAAEKQPKEARKRAGEEEKLAVRAGKRAEKTAGKAHTRDSMQELSKLGELVDGSYRWHGERVVQGSG